MDYQEAIDFLFPLHRFGIKPGLERTAALLEHLGHPEQKLGTVVHIAGTNGKGTVAACMASILRASGKKTGLFTSPHLIDFTERIRIDGEAITGKRVAEYCSKLKPVVMELGATFFETTTAMAFAFFADEGVDASVIETGMGGRLDATNLVSSDMVIIPAIGLDHTAWLGGTLHEIAAEKAAIIKKGSRVFTAVTSEEALEPIRQAALCQKAELHQLSTEVSCEVIGARPASLDFQIAFGAGPMHRFTAPLTGAFHADNAALAIMAARSEGIAWQHIAEGLDTIRSTGYRGRLEPVGVNPLVLLDVSHNPDGMQKTVQTLAGMRGEYHKLFVLLGVAADKDAAGIAQQLSAIASAVVTVELPSVRSLSAAELARLCSDAGIPDVTACRTPAEGLDLLLRNAGTDDMILVTGSFYLAGEVAAMEPYFQQHEQSGSR